jgi:hypothetical protein
MDISKMNKLFISGGLNNDRELLLHRIIDSNDDNVRLAYLFNSSSIQQFIGNTVAITENRSFIIITYLDDEKVSIMVGSNIGSNYKIESSIDKNTYYLSDIFDTNIDRITNAKVLIAGKKEIDNYIKYMVSNIIIQLKILAIHSEYFNQKVVYIKNASKKGNKTPNRILEYRFNKQYFITDYIGEKYMSLDRIKISGEYIRYDPKHLLNPIFPLKSGIIISDITNIMRKEHAVGDLYNSKIAIAFNMVAKSTIHFDAYILYANGFINKITSYTLNCKYQDEKAIYGDYEFYPISIDLDEHSRNNIKNVNLLFMLDIFKYMAYHTELVSKKDVVIGSIETSSNYTPKTNDKPRFETSICSHKVYGITKKVIPVTEAEAKEKRKYTPCQYAVTVKGHFRHYKSGKVIWVEHYIRNKDKEFKPKDYVDKKKEG